MLLARDFHTSHTRWIPQNERFLPLDHGAMAAAEKAIFSYLCMQMGWTSLPMCSTCALLDRAGRKHAIQAEEGFWEPRRSFFLLQNLSPSVALGW